MADYWKSQPRKFCQYCKCWIADNKPSIDFHERGKNHKENVAAKISEIKKKSVQKHKQDQRMCKQFAAMEEAALKAYEEDLKRMEREAAFGPEEPASTTSTYQPVPTVQPSVNKQEEKQKKTKKKPPQPQPPPPPQARPQPPYPPQHTGAALWVAGKSAEGHTYYYNTVTGESRWEKPQKRKEASDISPPGTTEIPAECFWTEALSPEGYTYYYHTVTGASSWEKPTDDTPKEPREEGQRSKPSNTEEEGPPSAQTEEGALPSSVPELQPRKRKADSDSAEEVSEAAEETKESEVEKDGTSESKTEEENQDETPAGRFRPVNPYGTWERIRVQKDPYASVDLQLPQVQSADDTAVELPPEPKHKFRTRVITSLGDSAGSSSLATFKKKKTHNGKSRSLRQRDDDD